MHNQN